MFLQSVCIFVPAYSLYSSVDSTAIRRLCNNFKPETLGKPCAKTAKTASVFTAPLVMKCSPGQKRTAPCRCRGQAFELGMADAGLGSLTFCHAKYAHESGVGRSLYR